MPKFVDDIKVKFQTLPPDTKRNVVLGGFVGLLLVVTYSLVTTFSEEPVSRKPPPKKPQYDILTGTDSSKLGVDQIAKRIETINQRIERVEEGVQNGKKKPGATVGSDGEPIVGKNSEASLDRLMDDPTMTPEDIDQLRQIRERRSGKPGDSPLPMRSVSQRPINPVEPPKVSPQSTFVPPVAIPDPNPPAPKSQGQGSRIKTFASKKNNGSKGGDGDSSDTDRESPPNVGVKTAKRKNVADSEAIVLPAGSIISGTLITGMDASSSSASKREPFPALLRIKAEAILPNRFRMDITDCFIVSSGYGDLASERAYMRAEAISCVKDDGSVLESNINAYAVGEDGKAGVRGRLVSKEGQLIAKSLMAGFLSGISNAMKPARVPSLSLNPQTNYQVERPDLGILAQESALGGISSATAEIAKYYLDMARNMFPIVEIDAGRKIDFVVSSGARLRNNNMGNQRGGGGMGGMGGMSGTQGGGMGSGLNALQQGLGAMGGMNR